MTTTSCSSTTRTVSSTPLPPLSPSPTLPTRVRRHQTQVPRLSPSREHRTRQHNSPRPSRLPARADGRAQMVQHCKSCQSPVHCSCACSAARSPCYSLPPQTERSASGLQIAIRRFRDMGSRAGLLSRACFRFQGGVIYHRCRNVYLAGGAPVSSLLLLYYSTALFTCLWLWLWTLRWRCHVPDERDGTTERYLYTPVRHAWIYVARRNACNRGSRCSFCVFVCWLADLVA